MIKKILVNSNMDKKIKYGVVGVGHLGSFHVEQLKKINKVELSGVYDINKKGSQMVAKKFNTTAFDSLEALLSSCNAISVVTSTPFHCAVAIQAIKSNCHVFIEKPICDNVNDAKKIISLAKKEKIKLQIGHIERFNPAYKALCEKNVNPLFIECHRLSPFSIRGTDVPVVLDLMIHDIDLVLNMVKQDVSKIYASGASIISDFIDLANARIEFSSGVTANLTASRISTKQMRQMRVFEKNNYSALDFQQQTLSTLTLKNKKIIPSQAFVNKGNALLWELDSFVNSIIKNKKTEVTGEQGLKALEIATQIQSIIEKKQNI